MVEGTPSRGMAVQQSNSDLEALRKLEASLNADLCAPDTRRHYRIRPATRLTCPLSRLMGLRLWGPRVRKFVVIGGSLCGLVLVAMVALWWRLSSGPIELDIATPWLTAAIKENFGAGHDVEIGGTQIERDANGRTSLRIRDIVVRDAEGTIVASAPKAEVGVSGTGLLTGRIRAERLSLVGAEMAVRIESDSKVTVFAGGNKRPFVTASANAAPALPGSTPAAKLERAGALGTAAPPAAPLATAPAANASAVTRNGVPDFAVMLAWIESLDASGLDGRDLAEIGLKGGNLTVDDQRNGKQWTFTNIDLGVMRPKSGGIAVTLGSENVERPWHMRAAMTPGQRQGHRIIDVEAQKVSAKDLMLAMRVGESQFEPDLPLSARIRADIGPDGIPHMLEGKILVDKGVVIDLDDPLARIPIDRAEINLDWDATRQALVMPFQVLSGGNRITLLAQFDAPREGSSVWGLQVSGGTVVLASAAPGGSEAAHPQPGRAAHAGRPRQAAHRPRSERTGQRRSWCRAHRQPRLFQRRSAPGARHCRHAHVGRGDEAAVADLHGAEGPRLGPRTCAGRHRRPAGHLDQRAVVHTQDERPACSRRRSADPDRRQRRGSPPRRRPAGDSRRRRQSAHFRPHGGDQCRPRQCGNIARPQALHHQRRVRGARHVPEGAAGEGALPPRRLGTGGGRTPGNGTAARLFRRADRSRDQSRDAHRASHARPAAQGGSRARIFDLHDQPRHRELRCRAHGHGSEGRGGAAQGQRQQPGSLDPGRRQDQRRSRRARLSQAARRRRRCPHPGHARRERTQQTRLRSQRLPHGAGADQAQRTHSGAGERHPLRDRGRSDPGQGRQPPAGLVEGRRPRGSRDLHAGEQIPGHPLRGPGGRSARRFGQGRDRGGWFRRRGVGEFPRLQPVRRRQGDAQGRPQRRRHAARDRTRRRL